MRRVLIPLHAPDVAPLALRAAQNVFKVVSLSGETMGTTWSVKAAVRGDAPERDLRRVIETCLARVIAQMSQWEPNSDVSRFNRAPAGTWQLLPEEFCRVLQQALELAGDSNGAYDPSIGALSDLWGFGSTGRRQVVPDNSAIMEAKAQCGWQRIALDVVRRAVRQPGGVRLDLSSIAKGFAVDLVSETLSKRGLPDHLVEIGGELRGSGTKPDLSPWWVTLEDADDMVIALHGLSIATSGDARRYVEDGDRRLSHTLDPRTGWPIPDTLASVTVLSSSCMKADALATALSVLGAEQGYRFACERKVAARFLMRTGQGLCQSETPAFAAMQT